MTQNSFYFIVLSLLSFQIMSFVIDDYFKTTNDDGTNKGLLIFTSIISFRLSLIDELVSANYLIYSFQSFMLLFNTIFIVLCIVTRNTNISKKSLILHLFSALFFIDYFVFLMPFVDSFWLLIRKSGSIDLLPFAYILTAINLLILIGLKLPLVFKIADTFILKGSCIPTFNAKIKILQLLTYIGLGSSIITRSNEVLYSIIIVVLIILNSFYLLGLINHYYFLHCHSIKILLSIKIFNCITLLQRLVTSKLYANIYLFVILIYFISASMAYLFVESYRRIWVFDFQRKTKNTRFKFFIMNILYLMKRLNKNYEDFIKFYINMREHAKVCFDVNCTCNNLLSLCSKYKDKHQFKLGNEVKNKSYEFIKYVLSKYKVLDPNDVDILFIELEVDFFIFNKRFHCIQMLSFLSDVNKENSLTSRNRIKMYECYFLQKYLEDANLSDNIDKNNHINKIFDTEKFIAEMFILFTNTYTLLKTFWIEIEKGIKNFDFIHKAARRIQENNARIFEIYDILERHAYKKVDYKYIYASYCHNLLNDSLKAGEIVKEIYLAIESFTSNNMMIEDIEYLIPDCVSIIIKFKPDGEGLIDFCSHNIEHLTGFKRFLIEKQDMNILIPNFLQHYHKKKVVDLCHSSNISFDHKNTYVQNEKKNLLPCKLSLKLIQNFSDSLRFNLLLQVSQSIHEENNIQIVFIESISKKIMSVSEGLNNIFETSFIIDSESKEITNQLFTEVFHFCSPKLFDRLAATDEHPLSEFSFAYENLPKNLTNKALNNKHLNCIIRYKIGEVIQVEDLVFVGIYFMVTKDGLTNNFTTAEHKLRVNLSSDNFKKMTKSYSTSYNPNRNNDKRKRVADTNSNAENISNNLTNKNDINQEHKIKTIIRSKDLNKKIIMGYYLIAAMLFILSLVGFITIFFVEKAKIGYVQTLSNYSFNHIKQRNYLYHTMLYARLYYFLSLEGYEDIENVDKMKTEISEYLESIFILIDVRDKDISILRPKISENELVPSTSFDYSRIIDDGIEISSKGFREGYFSIITDTKQLFSSIQNFDSQNDEFTKLFFSYMANGLSQMSGIYEEIISAFKENFGRIFSNAETFTLLIAIIVLMFIFASSLIIWAFYFYSERKITQKINTISKVQCKADSSIKRRLLSFRRDLKNTASNFYELTLLDDRYNFVRFKNFLEAEGFNKNNSVKLYSNVKVIFEFLNHISRIDEKNKGNIIEVPSGDQNGPAAVEFKENSSGHTPVKYRLDTMNIIFNRDFFKLLVLFIIFSVVILLNYFVSNSMLKNVEINTDDMLQLDEHNFNLHKRTYTLLEHSYVDDTYSTQIDNFVEIYQKELDTLVYNQNNSLNISNRYNLRLLISKVDEKLKSYFNQSICQSLTGLTDINREMCLKFNYYTKRELPHFLDQLSTVPLNFKTDTRAEVTANLAKNQNYQIFYLYLLTNKINEDIDEERVNMLEIYGYVSLFAQLLLGFIFVVYTLLLIKIFSTKFKMANKTFNGLLFIDSTIIELKKNGK